jgi:hypothetical protein
MMIQRSIASQNTRRPYLNWIEQWSSDASGHFRISLEKTRFIQYFSTPNAFRLAY